MTDPHTLSPSDIDHRLGADDDVVPSSGFAERVMTRVRSEAATPPPIAFPWIRALPGIAAMAIALVASLASAGTGSAAGPGYLEGLWADAIAQMTGPANAVDAASAAGAPLLLALVVTAGSLALAMIAMHGPAATALRWRAQGRAR